jgi:Invasin, domain 3
MAASRCCPGGLTRPGSDHLSFDDGNGLLFTECLADASCAALYRKSLRQAQVAIDGLGLDSLASATATLLAPWEQKEFDNARREHSPGEIAADVQDTRDFIAARPAELTAWLADEPESFAAHVAVALVPGSIVANGTSTTTATATVTDADGNPVPGDSLAFSSSDSGTHFGAVVDHGDGTYSVPITASTVAGQQSITASDTWASPDVSGAATLTQAPGPAAHVAVAVAPGSLPADGASTAVVTATVTDASGNPVSGDQVGFSSSDPGQRLGPVADHGNGTYSATVTASEAAGTATLTVADSSVDPVATGTVPLTQKAVSSLVDAGAGKGTAPGSTAATTPPPSGSASVPTVTITGKPAKRGRDRTPTFRFSSSDLAATFQCKLDDHAYRVCSSPATLSRLTPGAHRFAVKPIDASGQVGAAASFGFFIKPHHH